MLTALEDAIPPSASRSVRTYQLAVGWDSLQFVLPAHGVVGLLGVEIVPVRVRGLQAGRATQGQRFEASKLTLDIRDADCYEGQMDIEGAVIPDFVKRRAEIDKLFDSASAAE